MAKDLNKESDGSNNIDKVFDPCVGMWFDNGQEFASIVINMHLVEGFRIMLGHVNY